MNDAYDRLGAKFALAVEAEHVRQLARALMPRSSGQLARSAGISVSMENAETLRRQFAISGLVRAGGFSVADVIEAVEPPKRQVIPSDGGLFSVSDSTFTTVDRTLAEAVAAELDRIDPLPG